MGANLGRGIHLSRASHIVDKRDRRTTTRVGFGTSADWKQHNQLARLGHVQVRKHGGLGAQPNNSIGTEEMRQLEKLEAKVARFDDRITIRVRTEQIDDH